MALIKLPIVVALVAVLALYEITVNSSPVQVEDHYGAPNASNTSYHLIVGSRQYGDRIVYQENISERYLVSGKKLILNRTINTTYDYAITQVKCLNQVTDGTGAEVALTGGGPGFHNVSIRFKSQRWRGVYFILEVFAKRMYF